MRKLLFFCIISVAIISCQKSEINQPVSADSMFYNSLWKLTIKSDTTDIIIDSVDFSSFNNNFASPPAILFLNDFKRINILSRPSHFSAYNYIGGWKLNQDAALPYDMQLAFILQYSDTPDNQLSIVTDSAYFRLNADSSILYSSRIVHDTSFIYGQGYHVLDSIRLNRER